VRGVRAALAVGGLLFGVGAEWSAWTGVRPGLAVADLAVGLVLLGCGLWGWERRPRSWVGPLLAGAGFTWFVGTAVGPAAFYLHRGPLVHAALGFPSGRPASRAERAAVAAGYVDGVVAPVARADAVTLVLCLTLAALVGVRSQRGRTAGSVACALFAGALWAGSLARLTGSSVGTDLVMLLAYEATLCVVAALLLAGLLGHAGAPGAVTDLVVELGDAARPATLREALSEALCDPSLTVGYWVPEAQSYADAQGHVLARPTPGSARAMTELERDGRPFAAVVHDRAALGDVRLIDAVATAARLGAAHARLQAAVAAQLDELRASRRRIVLATDAQRRWLERRLHAGAERRLAGLADELDATRREADDPAVAALLGTVVDELAQALADVRRLARGIHPYALTEHGLQAALQAVTRSSTLPVELDAPPGRFAPEAEAAAYFLVAEGLANVGKYAQASRVTVTVCEAGERLLVTVADDGVGGADPAAGSGLRGLADRLEALGGRLRVTSSAGAGTTLVGEIPLSRSATMGVARTTPARRGRSRAETRGS
jgi:signal transduction histidine kinase